mgnify:CR=1 FL=1
MPTFFLVGDGTASDHYAWTDLCQGLPPDRRQAETGFYLTVPLVSIAGGTLCGSITIRLLRQVGGLVDLLAIALITAILGQVFENHSKLVWYLVWAYPGWIYLVAILALGLLLPAWCLVHWLRLRTVPALLVGVGMFVGQLILALAFTSFTGVSIPGS